MNYGKMWFELKKYVDCKNSHGKNELLSKMVNIEIEANTDYMIITTVDGKETIKYLSEGE